MNTNCVIEERSNEDGAQSSSKISETQRDFGKKFSIDNSSTNALNSNMQSKDQTHSQSIEESEISSRQIGEN
jgi:hypothetical protein